MLRLKAIHIENKPTTRQRPVVGYNPQTKEMAWQEQVPAFAQMRNTGQEYTAVQAMLKWDRKSLLTNSKGLLPHPQGLKVEEAGYFKVTAQIGHKTDRNRIATGIQFIKNDLPLPLQTLIPMVEIGAYDFRNTLSLSQIIALQKGDWIGVQTFRIGKVGQIICPAGQSILRMEQL